MGFVAHKVLPQPSSSTSFTSFPLLVIIPLLLQIHLYCPPNVLGLHNCGSSLTWHFAGYVIQNTASFIINVNSHLGHWLHTHLFRVLLKQVNSVSVKEDNNDYDTHQWWWWQGKNQKLTKGSSVSKSFILFPLKLRCVSLGLVWRRFSPADIRLSLNSSCNNHEETVKLSTCN